MLNEIVLAIKSEFKSYSSEKAKGVIASGIAAKITDSEKFRGISPNSFNPKNKTAGTTNKVKIENRKTETQSFSFPNLACPKNNPITKSTIGVTELEIICKEFVKISGKLKFKIEKINPKIVAIKRGFLIKENAIFAGFNLDFPTNSIAITPKVKITNR